MKKPLLFLLAGGGTISLLLVLGAGIYGVRHTALVPRYAREGQAQMAQKEYAGAIEACMNWMGPQPDLVNARLERGRAYYNSNKDAEAIAEFTQAIALSRLESNQVYGYTLRGKCFAREKQWSAAIEDYTRAIAISPRYEEAYSLRGMAYSKTQRFKIALLDANEAIRLGQSFAPYVTRALIYDEMGDYVKAAADSRKATELEPNAAYAWAIAGYTQYKAGALADAENSDRRAIKLYPGSAMAHFNLGLCFSVLNHAAEAKKEYLLALADSDAGALADSLGVLCKAQADHPNTPAIKEAIVLFADAEAKANATKRKTTLTELGNENAE